MSVFLIWAGFVSLILTGYILLLWLRNRKRSRFRAKLTIVFLLFVMVPSITLTFFIANLINQSANLLLLPGMEEALDVSLETLRIQVEECGFRFLERHIPDTWTPRLLQAEQIAFAGLYRKNRGRISAVRTITEPGGDFPSSRIPDARKIADADSAGRTSSLVPIGDRENIIVYRALPDSFYTMAGYPMPMHVEKARNKITDALGIYNTLSLLKESIIQRNLIWGMAVLLVFGLAVLSVFSAKKISRGISEPIHNLVSGMKKVAGGNLSLQVETKAKDEIRFLVDSFNTMIRDLQSSREKLIQAERLAAWREVARRIAHEIKNSLTPVSVSLRRLQNHLSGMDLDSAVTDSLQTVEDELKDMGIMAAEFSEFARMPDPQKTDLSINEIVTSVISFTRHTTPQMTFKTTLSEDLPTLNADRGQMKRMLTNLIKNAVEASPERSTITVTTHRSSQSKRRIALEIRDNGIGMDVETKQKIFTPYFTTKKRGTGLGLAIVHKIVDDHNGDIRVESSPGSGTTCRIDL